MDTAVDTAERRTAVLAELARIQVRGEPAMSGCRVLGYARTARPWAISKDERHRLGLLWVRLQTFGTAQCSRLSLAEQLDVLLGVLERSALRSLVRLECFLPMGGNNFDQLMGIPY